jgi:hypothetical protein
MKKVTITMPLKIKNSIKVFFLFAIVTLQINGQEKSVKLQGFVKYDSKVLANINIINETNKTGVASDSKGKFEIYASIGDSILFSSISFKNRKIKISETHIENKFITVYLEPGFNELDEVEILKKIRLDFGDVSLSQRAELDIDEMTNNEAPNMERQIDPNAKFQGMSLIGIYELLTKKNRAKKRNENDIKNEIEFLKKELPNTIKIAYGDDFFTDWLYIKNDQIYEFLDFCQSNGLGELYKSDEIYIKDFLIKQSKIFNKIKNE